MTRPVDYAIPLSIAAAAVFGPVVARALSRAFPPRVAAVGEFESLRARYGAIGRFATISVLAVFAAFLCGAIAWRLPNTPWLIGVLYGWAILTPILIIAFWTLPRGIHLWREFWRYYELKERLSLRFVAPVYFLVGALGILSTAMLLARR